MDANYREVLAGKASPIAKPSLSSELDRQLSPTNSKRPFSLRPSPGLVPLTTASGPSTNLWGLTKTSSFSSTASKFKPFSKYRTRRLSDDSLTDLSPPTHSDLDCISALWNVPTDQVEQQEPPSPEPSRRNSAIFLGNFKPSSLSHNNKPSKESRPTSSMNLFKGQGAQPSFSSRLRLLSKNSPEKQASEKPKPPYNKTPTTDSHVARSLIPAGLKSFQNKAVNLELDLSHSAGAEEIEAIKSPSCDIRIQANSNYPPRSCSIGDPPGVHNSTHELCRSSSSPNLNLPNTFSQRLSAESIRKNATAILNVSPKRGHAPPPIKVPKLRASSLAIAVGSDSSPVGTRSSASFRHGHSRSDCGNHFVRLITTLEWPGRKPSAQEHHVDASKQPVPEAPLEQTNPKAAAPGDMSVDTFDPPSTSSATRNDMISISNSLKVIKDKVPEVLPLQPAPRRLSHSRSDSKGPTMPLFISKHSRTVGTAAPAPPQNPSRFSIAMTPENVTRDPQPSAGQTKEALSSGKFSSTPTPSLYPETPRCHRSPIQDSPETQEVPAHARRNFSPGFIPFPTSEWPGQPACPSEDDLPSPSTNEEGDIQFQVELAPSSQMKNRDRLPAKKEKPRITSFDIRNFPLHLDTSQRSESLPSIVIPQSIKIPQFASGSLPSLPTSRDGHNPIETTGELSSSSHLVTTRPYESSDLSSLSSVISNGSSAEAHRSMNSIFTPASTPISNRSTGFPLAQPSHKPTTPCYSARDSTSRSLSVDDFYLNINSNALLDLSRRDGKKISPRPRSMSDRGPNRYDIFTEVFGRSIDSIHNSPRTAMYSLPLVNHQFPQSTRWNTTSIAQMIRESTTSELDKLVTEALKTYHPDSHRFVTGDIKELIREGRQAEQKAEDLHRRYLADLHAREKLLHRQVTTSRALNGRRGARAEESLLKSVMDTDQLASELLGLIDHTSKIDRMCEAHWRAAATVQMNNLAMKEAQLEAAQSRIEQLESDRARHLQQISDLQAKIDFTQDQARPPSKTLELDPLCHGSFATARMNSKGSYEFTREGFAPDSPSSTPRISQFPPHCLQQLPHTTFHRTSRFNSAHSLSSSHSSHSHSPCENSFAESSCPPAAFPEPVSPRTAFLSPYGLSHNQAGSRNRSDSSSLSVIKNEPGPSSPRKTHLSNASLSALPIAVTTFQRSDSIGSRKKAGLIPRNILTTNNSIKPKGSLSSIHFKTSRSSSLNSSDLKIEAVENKVAGSHDAKPRSTSNTFLPYLVNITNAAVSEATPTDGSNEFQATSTASRGPSSSSLTRFPRQAAPAPKLPLPYESNTRRRAQWSPSTPVHGNLSSITLSQLGSNDIANLLSSIESRQ
ncbi:hypothetical protein PCANC_16328 [Puccinia coronata f. sp. avenae]|uniref:Uncharacterized protein n=1 Tax=Puccinia coronata f. sp. avenae TaxID=200324 RepID=A0A2N5SK54_9BASI|nr:hypothetical protein PCANC_16328 [Puccinia coronata f. sp. avenae]